jgi:hypothetical protein
MDTQFISELIQYCNENYIQKILDDLRKENILAKEYSISGWNMFFRKVISIFINVCVINYNIYIYLILL